MFNYREIDTNKTEKDRIDVGVRQGRGRQAKMA
jgi:hypothetical protein